MWAIGEDHAAIEQAEAVGVEGDGNGDAVAAVTVEEQRGGAVARRVAAIDEGDGNCGAVGRGGVQALADVLRWVVAAEDRLLLAQGAFAGCEVVVEDGARRDERFVLEAELCGREFGIGAERRVVGRFGEFDAVTPPSALDFGGEFECLREIDDAEVGEAIFAFEEDEMGSKTSTSASMTSGDVGMSSRQNLRRGSSTGAVTRRKVRPRGVGADEEDAAADGARAWQARDDDRRSIRACLRAGRSMRNSPWAGSAGRKWTSLVVWLAM